MDNFDQKFNISAERDVDVLAEESYSWLGRYYIIIKKARIKTWKAVLVVAFLSGIVVAGTVFLTLQVTNN